MIYVHKSVDGHDFVNVNHALFSAWKNQKIDQVNIANKFKGVQMQFLQFNKFAYSVWLAHGCKV